MSWSRPRSTAALVAVLAGCLLWIVIKTVPAQESPLPHERLRGDIEALGGGGNFRSSDWGATPDEVQKQEPAEMRGREHLEEGAFSLLYIEETLGLTAEVRYFFDANCTRLVGGSITFSEPVSELGYLSIIKTFGNIYGDGDPTMSLINGGSYTTWQYGETMIALLHQPYGDDVRLQYGIDAPELMEKPPTAIYYRMNVKQPENCEFSQDK